MTPAGELASQLSVFKACFTKMKIMLVYVCSVSYPYPESPETSRWVIISVFDSLVVDIYHGSI